MAEGLLAELSASMPDLDAQARDLAVRRWGRLAKPTGSLGRLEALGTWLCAAQGRCPPDELRDVRVIVFAGDHGIADAGVSAYPASVTAAMVREMVHGGAAVNVLARQVGATVQVLDISVEADLSDLGPAVTRHKVRQGSGSIDHTDAMSEDEATRAFDAGIAVADEAVDAGAQVLIAGDMGIGNTTPSAALVGLLTRSEVVDVVGRGSGIDDIGWMRKASAIRDAMHRGRDRTGDPIGLLAAVGGADLAAMAGFVTRSAHRRTPVILDGLASATAALIAQRVTFRAPRWYLAAHLSGEPAHAKALDRLGLDPLVDVRMRLGEGTGALLAVPVVRSAAALLAQMASLEDATGLRPAT